MRNVAFSLLALLSTIPAAAWAQDPSAPTATTTVTPAPAAPLGKNNWPTSFVDRPLGLSAGMVEVDVLANSSLSKDAVGKPVNMPLTAFFGVTDNFQLSLSHSTGLCLSGKDNGCTKVYNDARVTGLYSVTGRGSNFEFAAWAALNFTSFDPGLAQAVIGPAINWVIFGGNAALLSFPGLNIGLNKRDSGNKESIEAPTFLYFRAGTHLAPYLFANVYGPFSGFSDNYSVPVGAGAIYGINNNFDVGGLFQFTKLAGGSGAGADGRAVTLFLNVRPL
jgi:hypothetical protein